MSLNSTVTPEGAEIGRPFTLTVVGRNLGEEARITTTLPGAFTPVLPPANGMQTPSLLGLAILLVIVLVIMRRLKGESAPDVKTDRSPPQP